MTEQAVRSWLEGLLRTEAGFDAHDAAAAAEACSTRRGEFSVDGAATAATAVIATRRLPGGAAWWRTEGQNQKTALLRGEPDGAAYPIAELLAEPAPDEWDPNWPEHKRFKAVPIPRSAKVGDEFTVGNGEGHRGRFKVVERDGSVGAELLADSWSLSATWDEAWEHVENLRRESPEGDR